MIPGTMKLDRYIFRSFLITFFSSIFLFVSLILFFDMMQQMKYFLRKGTPISLVLEMYYYKAFFQFTLVSPASALFATIYTIGRMARDNELIAIINSGVSIYRLCLSLMVFGLLFSIGMVPFNDHVVFPATRKAEKLSDLARLGIRERGKNRSDVKLWPAPGMVLKASYYNHRTQQLYNPIVTMRRPAKELAYTPPGNIGPGSGKQDPLKRYEDSYLHDVHKYRHRDSLIYRVSANRGNYLKERRGWMLFDGIYRRRYRGGVITFPFKKRFFPLPVEPYDLTREKVKMQSMTTSEASRYIEKLKKNGQSYGKELVNYYLKFSFPLINFVIIMIGISFGGFGGRKAVLLLSFFIAVIIYFLYYAFVAFGISLGKLDSIPPIIGAWLGNLVFFVLSLVLLIRRKT